MITMGLMIANKWLDTAAHMAYALGKINPDQTVKFCDGHGTHVTTVTTFVETIKGQQERWTQWYVTGEDVDTEYVQDLVALYTMIANATPIFMDDKE